MKQNNNYSVKILKKRANDVILNKHYFTDKKVYQYFNEYIRLKNDIDRNYLLDKCNEELDTINFGCLFYIITEYESSNKVVFEL